VNDSKYDNEGGAGGGGGVAAGVGGRLPPNYSRTGS
jgi:hypothetical protein